jgi:hypothetical protein
MAATAAVQCVCTECREKFPRGTSGAARGMCAACYRASRPDRAHMRPRADVDVVRETKVGLTEELDAWLVARVEALEVAEAAFIREALEEKRAREKVRRAR